MMKRAILRVITRIGTCWIDRVTALITSFRDLNVWRKGMELCVRCHQTVHRLPRSEQAVLGFQVRKSAVSIPSNIAEGFSRHSTPSYLQHLWIAHASAAELETQIELGLRLGLISREHASRLIADTQEIGRMINGLARSLGTPRRAGRLGPE